MIKYIRENLLILIVIIIVLISIIGLSINNQRNAYIKGYEDGIDKTLDTCNRIFKKQIADSNSVTKLRIETSKDTNTYILSKKRIK